MVQLAGTFDGFEEPRRVYGWVTHTGNGDQSKLRVVVNLDGWPIGEAMADQARPGLESIADGKIAFDFDCDVALSLNHFVEDRVRLEAWLGEVSLGYISPGHVFRRIMASHAMAKGVAALRSAVRIAGPELLEEAAAHSGVAWSDNAKWKTISVMGALAETPPDAPGISRTYDVEKTHVMSRFESLGVNCEFGLVLRHFGVEQSGLLRWGASGNGLPGLIDGINRRFEAAGDRVELYIDGTEYISRDLTHNLVFHTDRHEGQVSTEVLQRNEAARISYLARNIVENIEDGLKIFVYKDYREPNIEEIKRLLAALHTIGRCDLLWVVTSSDASKHGLVEVLQPNLYRGYLDRFSPPENIHAYCSFELWLELCRQCLVLSNEAAAY